MTDTGVIKRLKLPVAALLSLGIAGSAQAVQEPEYRYAFFKITSFTLADPSRNYCPQCRDPNPQTSATTIHSAIFELPVRRGVDLFETGREFCNQARRHFGEAWWKQRGFRDCLGGWPNTYTTSERAIDELQREYKYNASRPANESNLIFQFDDFKPRNFTLVVLRWPGANPAPAAAAATPATAGTSGANGTSGGTTRFTPPPSTAAAAAATGVRPAPPAPPAEPLAVPVISAQEQAELAAREKLNREQAAFAARQLSENKAAQEAFDKATREREATIARQQAEYQAALAAQQAEAARREREHAAAMERWRADVAACKAGDSSRCQPRERQP